MKNRKNNENQKQAYERVSVGKREKEVADKLCNNEIVFISYKIKMYKKRKMK